METMMEVMNMNKAVLNDLPDKLNKIEANDKISGSCKYPLALVQGPHDQKQTNTRGLAKLPKLKIGTKVMLTVNINIQDSLINS